MIVRFVHKNNDPLYNYVKRRESVLWGKKTNLNVTKHIYFVSVITILLIETESIKEMTREH